MSCNLFAQVKIITRVDSLFFIGIDNEVIIQSLKIPVEKLAVTIDGGTISGSKGKYIVYCSAPNTDISVKVFYKKKLVADRKMQSVRISDPVVYIAGDTLTTGGIILKKHLLTFNSLTVKTNVPFLALRVIRFNFKRISNNILTDSLKNEGYIFSPEIKKSLKKVMKGDVIIFEKAFSTGPDDNSAYRQLIKLTVSD